MSGCFHKRLDNFIRLLGRKLKRHPGVSLIRPVDDHRGQILENNGISCVDPAKTSTIGNIHRTVEVEDIFKNRVMDFVADILGYKIRSSGTASSLQGQTNGKTPEQTAKQNIDCQIVKQGLKVQDFKQQGCQSKLQRGQIDKTP